MIVEEKKEEDLLGMSVVKRGQGHPGMRGGKSLERIAEMIGGAPLDATPGHLHLESRDPHLVSQLLRTPMQSLWRPDEVEGAVVSLRCLLWLEDMSRPLLIWFSLHLLWCPLHPLLLNQQERRSTESWRKGWRRRGEARGTLEEEMQRGRDQEVPRREVVGGGEREAMRGAVRGKKEDQRTSSILASG